MRPVDADEAKRIAREYLTDPYHVISAVAVLDKTPTLTPPNEPLTIEQLREMDGEPAWWDDGDESCWGIISVDSAGMWGGIPFFLGRWKMVNFEYNIEERKMKIFRRPPERQEDDHGE